MDVQFYHLLATPLERALPKLMEKALATGERIAIFCRDAAQASLLDDALWTYEPGRFLAHGRSDKPRAEAQPICLCVGEEAPNHATIAAVLDGRNISAQSGFARVLDLFDGHNEEAAAAARVRWKEYTQRGLSPRYVQQQKDGGWQVKQAA